MLGLHRSPCTKMYTYQYIRHAHSENLITFSSLLTNSFRILFANRDHPCCIFILFISLLYILSHLFLEFRFFMWKECSQMFCPSFLLISLVKCTPSQHFRREIFYHSFVKNIIVYFLDVWLTYGLYYKVLWKFIIHIWTPYYKSNEGQFLYISVLIFLTVEIY